jgi:hypothetical protein
MGFHAINSLSPRNAAQRRERSAEAELARGIDFDLF